MSTMGVNKDLQKERQSALFDAEKLTEFLYGGTHKLRRRRYLKNIILQDKYLNSFTPWWNREREESYDVAVKMNVYLKKLTEDLNITDPVDVGYMREVAMPNTNNPLGLHMAMFLPTILRQGTPEQIQKYGKPAQEYKILGTYAQTELGHGTFIRGLETTATYDPSTEEFIINSPTLTSMKYWPGSLGKTSNYVILMAQLYSKGQNLGLHSFIVQIRSLTDHRPMPGVTVGDIGNKMGFIETDNGFLMFDKYRVPRDAMLMRYAKIGKDGTYTPPQNARIAYGSMMQIRAFIVGASARGLSMACTIATRYSAVRRQSELTPGGEEPQILDYQTQQEKLFPLLAASYALIFTGNAMLQTYARITANIEKGDMGEMQVLHAVSCGLKALSSYTASDGVDVLRKACGGHGYSHASGMPKLFVNGTAACTYEGENTVMYLQCARYLVKCYSQAVSGQQLPGFMSYLNRPYQSSSLLGEDFSEAHLIEAYEHVAARLIKVAATRIQSLMKGGAPPEDARNMSSVLMVKAATLQSKAYVVKTFAAVYKKPSLDVNVAKMLKTLWELYAVCGINDHMGDFMQDGFISGRQSEMLMSKMLSLFAEIRPNAVALVDAFDHDDHVLQSCIGRYDGNVYEALYEYVKSSPLNKSDVMDSYYTTLKPLMDGTLAKSFTSAKL